MRLPEAVIHERDARAFELRKSGLSYRQIARALDISESTAHAAVGRVFERLNKKTAEAAPEVIRMELERLDSLMANLWPMTMPHDVPAADGNGSVRLPPNFDAIDRVLKIMDRRSKMLGLDSVQIQISGGHSQPELTSGKAVAGEITPEEEARRLLRVMVEAGVIERGAIGMLKDQFGDIVDAEVVDEQEEHRGVPIIPELGPGDEEEIPPPWVPDE